MYNPPRAILDMHLQGTAHSSEKIELQGVYFSKKKRHFKRKKQLAQIIKTRSTAYI